MATFEIEFVNAVLVFDECETEFIMNSSDLIRGYVDVYKTRTMDLINGAHMESGDFIKWIDRTNTYLLGYELEKDNKMDAINEYLCGFDFTKTITENMMEKDIKIFEFFAENNFLSNHMCLEVVKYDNLEYLEVLIKNNYEYTEITMYEAIGHDSIKCFKYLCGKITNMDLEKCCIVATQNGSLNCLKYVCEMGYEIVSNDAYNVIEIDNGECFKYVLENKGVYEGMVNDILKNDSYKCMRIYCEKFDDTLSEHLVYIAGMNCSVKCMIVLHEHNVVFGENIYKIVENVIGNYEKKQACLKYLREIGYNKN